MSCCKFVHSSWKFMIQTCFRLYGIRFPWPSKRSIKLRLCFKTENCCLSSSRFSFLIQATHCVYLHQFDKFRSFFILQNIHKHVERRKNSNLITFEVSQRQESLQKTNTCLLLREPSIIHTNVGKYSWAWLKNIQRETKQNLDSANDEVYFVSSKHEDNFAIFFSRFVLSISSRTTKNNNSILQSTLCITMKCFKTHSFQFEAPTSARESHGKPQ